MSETAPVVDYETMSPNDLMNQVEMMTASEVLNASFVLVFQTLESKMSDYSDDDAKRANELVATIKKWQKEQSDDYQPGKAIPTDEPKNVREYINQ